MALARLASAKVDDELERLGEVSSRLSLERLCSKGVLGRHG
jgi:hypothetical protein